MASLAERALQAADLNHVVEQRRRNFETLVGALEVNTELEPLWRNLEREAVAWGFPVLLRKRQERDYLIRARGVALFSFGEVLHPLLFSQAGAESRMVETSRYLSDTLLLLSIHQGLSTAQVARSRAGERILLPMP
jgi:dTDP-4-amino-4,6-dideoxygalactose transaminase